MFELIGPENSMAINTLHSDLDIFFSRNTKREPGEFLVEKQEAEQGSMPTISAEPSTYGYTAEDSHMVRSFMEGKQPSETWKDGLSCLELIMSCYVSAETGRKVKFAPQNLENYVPRPARAEWSPRMVLEGS